MGVEPRHFYCRFDFAPTLTRLQVISFPADAPERFMSADGEISIEFEDLLDRVALHEL